MTATAPLPMLPAPSALEAEHSAAVRHHIMRQIDAAGGWLSFETFMQLALYAPGLGYYSAGSVKLGAAGDFTTAPEMSELFGRLVARQCAQVLAAVPDGAVLELGAGTGRLAATVLLELDALGQLPRHYDILEVSADLAQRQRVYLERLPEALRARVRWLERLPPQPRHGVILANEVLDALPCQRFVSDGHTTRELGVARGAQDEFIWEARAADARLAGAVAQLAARLPQLWPPGYTSELCLRAEGWIASLAAALDHGALLLFDYGLPQPAYYHAQRTTGTLSCHFKHRVHFDPLIHPGIQDITAWVDFTRVAEAGVAAGLDVLGFATQTGFALGAGIDQLLSQAGEPREQARLAGEARRLLMPGEMGEAFKLLALGRGLAEPLISFHHQDLRDSL